MFQFLKGIVAATLVWGGLIVPASGVERIPFLTLTFADDALLSGNREKAAEIEISGALELPSAGEGPFPAMIMLHGSDGPRNRSVWSWVRVLNQLGVATFAVDSFTGRGIEKVSNDQGRFGALDNVVDAYAALTALAKDPRIDPTRIGVMGFSRGGSGALYSALSRFRDAFGDGETRFAVHVPFYAPCNIRLDRELEVTGAPIRAFHGEADDWTPFAPCRDYVDRLAAAGADAGIMSFPNALHSFDNPGNPAYYVLGPAQTSRNCTRIEREGRLVNAETGQPFSWTDACVEKGPAVKYDGGAAEASQKAVTAFLRDAFLLP